MSLRINALVIPCVAAALMTPGCAVDPKTGAQSIAGVKVSDDPCAKTASAVGAVVGGVLGAVVGNQLNSKSAGTQSAAVAAGAALGGLIGRDIDNRRCDLYRIAEKYNVEVDVAQVVVPKGALPPPGTSAASANAGDSARADSAPSSSEGVVGLSVAVRDRGRQFEANSDRLTPEARAMFTEIAQTYSFAKQLQKLGPSATAEDHREAAASLRAKRILLIGHTDDSGSSRGNAELSERRAMEVSKLFREQGIPEAQLFYQGAGETLPIADNRTEEGRARNRRVEIVDATDDASFQKFLASRTQRLEYYRQSPPTPRTDTAVAQVPLPSPPPAPAPAKATTPPAATATPSVSKSHPKPASLEKPMSASSTKPSAPATASAVAPSAASVGAPASRSAFDFGGVPAANVVSIADFGSEVVPRQVPTFISTAQASGGPVAPSCSVDRPRVSNGVKSLRDQKSISIAEYMPGLYSTSWMDTVNGNLVGLSNVAVLRDGGSPAMQPNLYIYRAYKPNSGAKPDFAATPEVNVYRGDKALLYRVFVDGPVKCMDLLFPYENTGEAKNASLFYDRERDLYVATFKPRLAR